jgi:hypothetical protein
MGLLPELEPRLVLAGAVGGVLGAAAVLVLRRAAPRQAIARIHCNDPRSSGAVVHGNTVYLSGQVRPWWGAGLWSRARWGSLRTSGPATWCSRRRRPWSR